MKVEFGVLAVSVRPFSMKTCHGSKSSPCGSWWKTSYQLLVFFFSLDVLELFHFSPHQFRLNQKRDLRNEVMIQPHAEKKKKSSLQHFLVTAHAATPHTPTIIDCWLETVTADTWCLIFLNRRISLFFLTFSSFSSSWETENCLWSFCSAFLQTVHLRTKNNSGAKETFSFQDCVKAAAKCC